MKIIDCRQGDEVWHALRAKGRGASEAAAMLGLSKKTPRNELLRMKATGDVKEFSDWVQENLIDEGHRVEALARALREEDIADDLFPTVATDDDGYLIASSDGIRDVGTRAFEHKMWNEVLAEYVRLHNDVPDENWPQLEQSFIVFDGLEVIDFVVSDGTREKRVICEYRSQPQRRARILPGWKQFDADLLAYRHVETLPTKPTTSLAVLPELTIAFDGALTLRNGSNLAEWSALAIARVNQINTVLTNDEHFAQAESDLKWLSSTEEKLAELKRKVLSQAMPVSDAVDHITEIEDACRNRHQYVNRLVKTRKDAIRDEIRMEGVAAFAEHVAKLNERIGKPYMPEIDPGFAVAMKGKRNITTLRNAKDTALANAKISADAVAAQISSNLAVFGPVGIARDHIELFPDIAHIVPKAAEDFDAMVKARLADHRERMHREEVAAREAAAPVGPVPTAGPELIATPTAEASNESIRDPIADELEQLRRDVRVLVKYLSWDGCPIAVLPDEICIVIDRYAPTESPYAVAA